MCPGEQSNHRDVAHACRPVAEALERRVMLSAAWPAGMEFLVNTRITGLQFEAAVAADAAGNVVVTWESDGQDGSGRGIYAQRYDASGNPLGGEFRVNTYTTSDQHSPSVAMDADGDFIVAWYSYGQDGSSFGVYARQFTAAGVAQGGEFRVNTYTTGTQWNPAVASNADGDFVVAWESVLQDGSNISIFAQRYAASGMPLGDEFQVNTYTTFIQSDPSVAVDADGDFVITWRSRYQDGSGSGVHAQRYDAAGVPQGGEFQVNTHTLGPQVQPDVAMDGDGDFVIVWASIYQGNFNDGIFAQRYNAAGQPQGGEFRINTYTTAQWFPLLPAIAMDADGGFVVAWQSTPATNVISLPQDGSGNGVYARRFSADGVPLSGEFRVNTFTAFDQGAPAVARASGGDFVVAFSGAGAADPSGVYVQRYVMLADNETAHVGDRVWDDLNGDGVQDGGEPGLSDVEVELYTATGTHVDSTRSDADGVYGFAVLPGDSAYLRFRTPAGLTPTRANAGSHAAIDSDVNRISGVTPVVVLPPVGQFNADLDAGFLVPASISGVVFNDRNANGERDPGEQGVPGVQLFADVDGDGVRDDDEPIATSTASGDYTIGDLLPDTYAVAVVDQDRWTAPAPTNVAVPVSSSVAGVHRALHTAKADTQAIPVGGELVVNTNTAVSGLNGSSVAMDAAGNYLAAWIGDGIRARRFSAAGEPIGPEFRVDSSGNGGTDVSVAMAGNGSFVVVWSGVGQNNSFGIWARRFSASAAPLGNDFKVNTLGASFAIPHAPSIAMRRSGEFVVAWTADVGTATLQDIYARRYNAAGTAQGTEVRVNVHTPLIQRFPSVAVNAQGDFVVAWESEDQDGSDWGIYARRFNEAGAA